MEQLKVAWVYRFWIIVGIVVVMPIVSYFVDTRTLANNAASRANKLKSDVTSLEGAAKGPLPNEKWVEGVSSLKDVLSSQVDVAWEDLYKRQVDFKTWPAAVKEAYVSAGPKADDTKFDPDVKIKYQELYPPQLTELFNIVKPVQSFRAKGLVDMNLGLIFKYSPPWAQEETNPPSIQQAWQAQEDIWLLRALLSVIKRANEGSTSVKDSAVKKILDLSLGTVDYTFIHSKNVREQLSPRGGFDAPVAGAAAAKKDDGEIRGPLFRQIPIHLRLVVDQPRILKILGEFGNSEIPMQVTQVEFYELPIGERNNERLASMLGESAKKADTANRGRAPLKDDEFFQMAELDVYARAFIYEKPPRIEQEENAAAEKAKAQVAAPPAAPTAPNQ